MKPAPRDVVISGLGAVCALGEDCPSLWSAIEVGCSGIEEIRRFPTDGYRVHTGAMVKTCAEPDAGKSRQTGDLFRSFALAAAREAMQDAGVDASGVPRGRIGFVFGTGVGDFERPIHALVGELASTLRLYGPRIAVATACSSSTGALGLARDLIAMDFADMVVAGGADVLAPEVFAGFHALGVLSPEKCAPYSLPVGTTLGEGAGFVVLEPGESARRRGATELVAVSGYGLSGDAYHETSPDPTGSGVERAVCDALSDAAIDAAEIGYVNVHGSGTAANDHSEWLGIKRGLGSSAEAIPLSSSKGALGHAQGAAGVLEAIVTVLAMKRDLVPPTLNFDKPRPNIPTDPVIGSKPRAWSYQHALCLNAAFGGANAAVVLSQPGRRPENRKRRTIYVSGVGAVGPYGLGCEAFMAAQKSPEKLRGRVPLFSIEQIVRAADPRGLDPASRYLTAAVALGLKDAGVTMRGKLRDRTGLLIGVIRPSPASLSEFWRSIEERGLPDLSAAAFARIVLNSSPGFCSKLLSLRGPLSTITTGPGSALTAIALSAEILSTHTEPQMMIAGGVDEIAPDETNGDGELVSEGAACVILGTNTDEEESPSKDRVQLTGWGIAGPDRLPEAIASARDIGLASGQPIDRVFQEEDWRDQQADQESAAAGALACAAAVLALRQGEIKRALVTSDSGTSASVALLLTH